MGNLHASDTFRQFCYNGAMKNGRQMFPGVLLRKFAFGLACAAVGACAAGEPVLGAVSAEVAQRTASYQTATVNVEVADLGGAESVSIAVTARPQLSRNPSDRTFPSFARTGTATVTETGTCTVALDGLMPGRTYDLEVVATGADDATASASAELAVPAGFTQMCYKPSAGKTVYPWTTANWWFDSPNSQTTSGYLPSFGDNVLLYSSKNTAVPLSVAAGASAEMNDLAFCSKTYGNNRQRFAVSGTVTNLGNVVVGASGSTSTSCAADLSVLAGGEWAIWRFFTLGNSPEAYSTLTVEEGGRLLMPTDDAGESNISEMTVGGVSSSAGASLVTNRGEMVVWDLFIGGNGEGRVDNWGVLTLNRKLTIGRNAGSKGVLHLHKGGTLDKKYVQSKAVIVGHYGEGTLILDDNLALQGNDYLTIGNMDGATGRLEMNEAATLTGTNAVFVGNGTASTGTVEMAGTSRIVGGFQFRVASGEGAEGRVTLRDEARLDGLKDFFVGVSKDAKGVVDLGGASALTNLQSRSVVLGHAAGSSGVLILSDNAFIHSITNLYVGKAAGARGLLHLRGGRVNMPGGGGGVWSLYVGADGSSSQGTVRGWGAFTRPAQVLRMTAYGRIVADGEGEMRDLDFGWFRTVGTSSGSTPNLCGTNGWYAVNKGRVRYPHQQNNTTGAYRISGDYPNRSEPTLVNSFAFDLTGRTNDHFLHADLYAADRDDIPSGLAAKLTGKENRVQGVLRAGYFKSADAEKATAANRSDFTSGTISWRYDPTGLDADWQVNIYHHDGTASGSWQRVYRGAFDAEKTVLTTDSFGCSQDDWNLGWFAVVATKGSCGTMLIFR